MNIPYPTITDAHSQAVAAMFLGLCQVGLDLLCRLNERAKHGLISFVWSKIFYEFDLICMIVNVISNANLRASLIFWAYILPKNEYIST
jgi:hypothetical protein